jgi:hypothetical protein
MIRTLLLLALALLPAAAFSQDLRTASQPRRITRIIRVQYENPEKIAGLIIPGSPVSVTADTTLGVIVLKGTTENVADAEQTIKQLDAPPLVSAASDVELTVYLIGASNDSTSGSPRNPAVIEPVIKQLGAIFPYRSYELLSTMLLRSQQGRPAQTSGIMSYNPGSEASRHPGTYGISYGSATVSPGKSKATIHLNDFKFSARVGIANSTIPNTTSYQTFDTGTKSDLDIREGQKVVVGKTDIASDGSAIFIVLAAKLVD